MLTHLATLWHSLADIPHLKSYLTAAWVLYLLVLAGWIILQKREPVATISWVLSLAVLPYVGFLIYFAFGPQKIKRQRLRRHRSRSGLESHSTTCPQDEMCTELSLLGQAVTGLPPSSARKVTLLVDGAATYEALVEAIGQARDHVHLEYYIFERDHTGTLIRDALIERANAGVQVRLLLDAVGSNRVNRRFLKPLLDAGCEHCWFHPTQFRPFRRPWVNLRTHRKIVVIDGTVAFAGGINVTDEENDALRSDAYRDLHLRLEGEIVRELQQVFVEDWIYASGPKPSYFKDATLWVPVERTPDDISVQVITAGPDSEWEGIHRLQVGAINEAKERVWLVTPYFVPGQAAMMALTSAALSGLDVRLLVPKHSDSKLVTFAARSYFDQLLAAKVKVYEYGPRMLHTKALLCDNNLALLGSANFDNRSFRLNFEVALLFRDAAFNAQLAEFLQGEFAAATHVRDDRNRSLWRNRLPEALARLTSPVL